MTVVIGTAGHIDHGKTALLHALTGIDADRLPEERARGMTIDVGYAHLAFEDGVELDFVDVPGHERLVGNMLVGAGEIDAAMLVVAADDGPRPQTLEHLQLLDALGITGLAVITKVDLVDRARVDDVAREVRALVEGTSMARSPILAVSAVAETGLDELRDALRRVHDDLLAGFRGDYPRAVVGAPLRLAVDRAFSVRGRGVIVTGTLRGASSSPMRRGDLLRREPGGDVARVREVQVHGTLREEHDGGRTALNLAGLAGDPVRRGDVLTVGPRVRGAERLLVGPGVATPGRPFVAGNPGGWPLRHGGPLRLHIGTDQVGARVRRVPGVDGAALLDLDRPTATFAGDRAVLRGPERGEVVVGVSVLDPDPPRGVSRRRMTAERIDALAGAVATGDAGRIEAARIGLHGLLATELGDDGRPGARSVRLADDVEQALAVTALDAVQGHHAAAPMSPGLPLPRARAALLRRLRSLATVRRSDAEAAASTVARLLEGLVAEGRLARSGDALRDPSRSGEDLPSPLVEAMDRLEAALSVAAPPPLGEAAAAAGCPPEGIRALLADGRIIRLEADLAWSAKVYRQLAATALDGARSGPLSPAAFRDATGTSRKYVLAILEDLDRRGILSRTAEGHVPGPRAPRAGVTT